MYIDDNWRVIIPRGFNDRARFGSVRFAPWGFGVCEGVNQNHKSQELTLVISVVGRYDTRCGLSRVDWSRVSEPVERKSWKQNSEIEGNSCFDDAVISRPHPVRDPTDLQPRARGDQSRQ